MEHQPKNPLHGVKLSEILDHLVEKYGWDELGDRININCFNNNPSMKSSLGFLRKTTWAREKVERLYLRSIGKQQPPPGISPRANIVLQDEVYLDDETELIDDVSPQCDVEAREFENPVEDSSPKESPWDAAKRVRDSRG